MRCRDDKKSEMTYLLPCLMYNRITFLCNLVCLTGADMVIVPQHY